MWVALAEGRLSDGTAILLDAATGVGFASAAIALTAWMCALIAWATAAFVGRDVSN